MTTPTKEQCAKLARECGFGDGLLTWPTVDEKFHAFALKVLAEKELDVLKLREALQPFAKGDWTTELALKAQLELSTPPSTEALDEYVAARMAESKAKTCKWTITWQGSDSIYDTECKNTWQFEVGNIDDNEAKFCPYCGRKIDAAIEAEKVRE